MNDDQDPQPQAHAEENEAVLLGGRMALVVEQEASLVIERGAGLFERDAVLALVGRRLRWVPVKSQIGQTTMYVRSMYGGKVL